MSKLHDEIMSLPCRPGSSDLLGNSDIETRAYQLGHRDARHAAAELVSAVADVPDTPGDPLDWPIPCDLDDGTVTLRKGVKLRAVLARMKMLSALCSRNLQKAYQYDVEHPNDGLNSAPAQPEHGGEG